MKYLHNQKVTCEIGGTKITKARISIDEDGIPFICQNERNGGSAENKLGYKYSWSLGRDFTDGVVKNLRPAIKSFSNPEIGDEYKDRDGDSRFVLGVAGRVIFLSSICDKNKTGACFTKEELSKWNYTIVQDKPDEEIEELTVRQEVLKMVLESLPKEEHPKEQDKTWNECLSEIKDIINQKIKL